MPMPQEITLANVNKAIEDATINTDNNIMVQHYTSELTDIVSENVLMPSDIKTRIDEVDTLLKEVVLS